MNWFPEDAPVRSRVLETWDVPLHLVERGTTHSTTVLFLHGNPTWSYLYRHLLEPVSKKGFYTIAPDLPGFGRSGKWTDPEEYSFPRHVEAVKYILETIDRDQIILVGHDWGGPIGLRIACDEPERIAGIILINTGTFFRLHLPFFFRFLLDTGLDEFAFGRCNGFVEGGLRVGCTQRQKLTSEVMRHYRRPYQDPKKRAGIVAFPRMIPTKPSHKNWQTFRELEEEVKYLDRPAGIISGRNDPVFGPSYGHRMKQLLPRADHQVIEKGGHYLQEDQPRRLQSLIGQFLELTC